MADNFNATAGDGTIVGGSEKIGGVDYPRVIVEWGPAGTLNKTDIASGKALPIQVRSATGLIPVGEPTDAKAAQTDTTSVSIVSILKQLSAYLSGSSSNVNGSAASAASAPVVIASDQAAVATKAAVAAFADGAIATLGLKADAKSMATDTTAITLMQVAKQISASVQTLVSDVNANGQAAMAASSPVVIASNQTWPTGMSPRSFAVAFATLTRPANTTPYSAADSISDNATAGSVSALVSGNISDTNDDPLTLADILISSTDTGLAGKRIRAYVYNSDPTASSGVGAGDNSAFSNKKAGYVGSFEGWLETGFSDGTVGRLIPMFNETNNTLAGGFITVKPVSGAKTLYVQYQAVDAFTPSANSTTIIGTIRGFQGRAS